MIKGDSFMQDTINTHERLAALETNNESVERRLNNLEKLVDSIHTMATELKTMREDVNNVIDKVNEIESKPAKRWETFVTALLTGLGTGLIGYYLGTILK